MLPDAWVEKIFAHMSGLYGAKFADLWRGTDIQSVKRLWADRLSGFQEMPQAIKEALDSLDNKPFPPTLPEFLAMCREAGTRHAAQTPRLEHKPTPEEKQRATEAAKRVGDAVKGKGRDSTKWIADLEERAASGVRLCVVQQRMIEAAKKNLGMGA